MSDIKVLALDLDGTLTNDQKLVTPRTRAALDAAIEKGVTIVLASGRPTAGIQPMAEELGLDKKGGCILSYNGGKIVDCRTGETLVEKTLDPALVPELCDFAAAQDAPYDLFLSGSRSLLRIDNPNALSDRTLVVFRDSFGSSIIPLLAESYRTVYAVDIRYLAPDRLGRVVDFPDDADVLLLYSATALQNSITLK